VHENNLRFRNWSRLTIDLTNRRRQARLWLSCALVVMSAVVSATASDRPMARATVRPSFSISLDGNLNEPEWQDAPALKLIQQSPKPGEPTPFETEVRIIVTGDQIYFGFTCKDPNPRGIAVHTMRRDAEMVGDDTVSLILDTYGDRRTGYFFQINAAGARADGLVSDPESVSLDWDGIWDARTARTEEGWSAEIFSNLELYSRLE
jgi:hypothetical protein